MTVIIVGNGPPKPGIAEAIDAAPDVCRIKTAQYRGNGAGEKTTILAVTSLPNTQVKSTRLRRQYPDVTAYLRIPALLERYKAELQAATPTWPSSGLAVIVWAMAYFERPWLACFTWEGAGQHDWQAEREACQKWAAEGLLDLSLTE